MVDHYSFRKTTSGSTFAAAFCSMKLNQYFGRGSCNELRTAARSNPAAAALTSNAGSIGGEKSGSCRKIPAMFKQWRTLKSRSATVFQQPFDAVSR
jgi:hypothetical protein